ncbi:hypothetical protein PENSTE_c009G03513 [Penicillium steckii]|uniref:Complex III subunit 9 n=1 Tax=Penicillium steckii TaxID=303698 RepID=A0A1V6TAW5_9EURO|nr:hypothetical protein PENSTE_c009G03513 [Penicillium steckii]
MAGVSLYLQRYLPARLPLSHSTQWSHSSLDLPSNRGFFLYFRSIIRKNAVFLTTIFAGAFAFELSFDTFSNKVWDSWNAGRQWKDIKPRYLVQAEEEDDD